MKKSQSTYKSMMFCLLSMVLCLLMLMGTTYALFSDSATTGVNLIKTGTYDVDLQYSDDYQTWADVDSVILFNDVTLNPGESTPIKYLRAVNNNSYDVKVSLAITDVSVTNNNTDIKFKKQAANDGPLTTVGGPSPSLANMSEASKVLWNDLTLHAGESITTAVMCYLPENANTPNIEARFKFIMSATQAN